MLSGQAPFHAPTWPTEKIVDCIQHGSVSFDGDEWSNVSSTAKNLIKGLLTVNTSQRLTIDSLSVHPWLVPDSAPDTPLCTTISLKSLGATRTAINHTFHAYYQVTSKEGLVLGDPAQNPLARKRKLKSDKSPQPGTRPTTLEITDLQSTTN